MKKKVILLAGLLAGFTLSAQKESKSADNNGRKLSERTVNTINPGHKSWSPVVKGKNNAAVIYSWDFSNGLPTGWTNIGSSANALWEYRGPSTTPDNTVGTRGAYGNPDNVPTSPTAGNGFMIFDSDYLDNGGQEGAQGTGPAPAPHRGVLTTGTLDLSGHPLVQLSAHSFIRYLAGRTLVAFSTDDGVTYPDTVELYDIDVNDQTSTNERRAIDISSYVGDSSQVKLKFIYDGEYNDPAVVEGLFGYYFWMLDDVVISDLPKHELRFDEYVSIENGDTLTAPAHDMIFDELPSGGSNIRTGIMNIHQTVPIHFDGNLYTYGSETQTNVTLKIDIYNADDNSLVTSLTSSGSLDLAYGEFGSYETFYTAQWTPTEVGAYDIVYTATSDSIPSAPNSAAPMDTFRLRVHERLSSLDFSNYDNDIGTENLGDDGSAIGSMMHFSNKDASDSNSVTVYDARVFLPREASIGAELIFEAYDTTGFSFTDGFMGNALFSQSFIVNEDHIGTVATFQLEEGGLPPQLPAPGTYFFIVKMFSNGGASPVYLGNDKTFPQPLFPPATPAAIMYNFADGRWYSGYADSRSFNSPILRVNTLPARRFSLSDDNTVKFSVYPNPSTGRNIKIDFSEEGDYNINVINSAGQKVFADVAEVENNSTYTFDLDNAPKGVYFLTVASEKTKKSVTTKLSVQ